MKKYVDRYKTISVHLTQEEWKAFNKEHEDVCSSTGFDISKHKFIKMLLKRSMGLENGLGLASNG